MRKNSQGISAIGVIVIIAAVLGVIGVGYSLWVAGGSNSKPATTQTQTKKTEYKTITVNGYKLRYPLNDNNVAVVVNADDSNSPSIVYTPMQRALVTSTNDDCRNYTAGTLQADKLENLFGPSDPYGSIEDQAGKQAKIDVLIKDGKAVKLGDIYVLAPSKQNEPCEEVANPKDGKLQLALFESQEIEKEWLKSLELVR